MCGHPAGYKGEYHALPGNVAKELWPNAKVGIGNDCATNYLMKNNRINTSSMTCWKNKERWARKLPNMSNIVRCTNKEKVVCKRSSTGEVWCGSKTNNVSGNEMCGYPSGYKGKYYTLPEKIAKELWPSTTVHPNRDCATNYFIGDSINTSSMGCWENQGRWSRKLNNIVRCRNKE